jgi:tetratricopeptide (TPR) repeat protein
MKVRARTAKQNNPSRKGAKARSLLLVLSVAFCLPAPLAAQNIDAVNAISLEQQGRLDEAAAAWRSAVQNDPHDASAFASLGLVLSKQQKYAEAAAAYRKAISLNANLPGVQLNLGLAEFKTTAIPSGHPALAKRAVKRPS